MRDGAQFEMKISFHAKNTFQFIEIKGKVTIFMYPQSMAPWESRETHSFFDIFLLVFYAF